MNYEILARFLLAVLWGGMVGAEREYRSKSAGFRTMIMISVGSCMFTMLSVYIGGTGNPDRIASNIVTGIGFLGAGVIFHGTNRINGITTAATIWAVAAVGMSIGTGHYFEAGCASLLILIVLAVLPFGEELIDRWNQTKVYTVTSNFSNDAAAVQLKLVQQYSLRGKLRGQVKEGNLLTITWIVQGKANKHQQFIDTMLQDKTVLKFEY